MMSEAKPKLIANLDAILVEPVAFQLHGKQHVIKPLTTEQFMKFSAAYGQMYGLRSQKDFDNQEFGNVCFELIHSVVDSITRSDFDKMANHQMAGVITIIIETVTGKMFGDNDEKKKINWHQPVQEKNSYSTPPSFWRKFAGNFIGR